jgi:hypothetical protein
MALGDGAQARIDRLIMGIVMLAQAQSGRIEAHMKANAPWTDRTTNARNGLHSVTRVERLPGRTRIIVESGHSVDYGIYLERANGGRFAIVAPTLDYYGPDLLRQVRALVH